LQDAGLTANEINELVLVGGMTRMRGMVEVAGSLVGKQPHQGVNPDELLHWGLQFKEQF
jgi:molecular chaperone DnaK